MAHRRPRGFAARQSPSWALLAVALACHPADARAPAPLAARPREARATRVRLEHLSDGDRWRVTYALPERVLELSFVRDVAPRRSTHWKVTTPRLHLEQQGDHDVIVSDDARPFEEVSIELGTQATRPEKDYQAFFEYSDGGTLVYTGQFDVRAAGDAALEHDFSFVPRSDELIVLLGRAAHDPQRWRSDGETTYVYFGATAPSVEGGFVGVLDAGMPSWLFTELRMLLPRVSHLYGVATGIGLTFTPTVYLSYGRQESPQARSIGGGTLPQIVQMDVRLGQAIEDGPREPLLETVDAIIAHEMAHFWNAQMFHHDSPGGDWLHEGSADAFAYRALLQLGRLGETRLAEIESEAFSGCLLGTRLGPLHEASRPGRFKLYYWCGHLIAHITEGLAARSTPSRDLFGFWGELLRRSPGAVYSEEEYLSALRGLPGGARAEAAVRALLTGSAPDVVPALLEADPALVATPMSPATSVEALPAAYQELAGLVVATLLLRTAAAHDVTPTPYLDGWLVHGALGDPAEDLVLDEIEGQPLRRRGALAYDAAVEACRRRGAVTIGLRAPTSAAGPLLRRMLQCPATFAARPTFVRTATVLRRP